MLVAIEVIESLSADTARYSARYAGPKPSTHPYPSLDRKQLHMLLQTARGAHHNAAGTCGVQEGAACRLRVMLAQHKTCQSQHSMLPFSCLNFAHLPSSVC